MICPACGTEYEEGIDECTACGARPAAERVHGDCGNDAVSVPSPDDLELVTILETNDPGLLALVKSLLEGSGIPYWVQGEATQSLLSTPIFPSVFQVERRYENEVKALLEELRCDTQE